MAQGKPNSCVICEHPQRTAIDRAIMAGDSLRKGLLLLAHFIPTFGKLLHSNAWISSMRQIRVISRGE